MERNVRVIKDDRGNSIVMINDIKFKGKRQINWDEVKEYLGHKKRNEQPFRILRFYLAKTPFLFESFLSKILWFVK